MRQIFYDLAGSRRFKAHLAYRIPVELVEDLPTQAASPSHPQSFQPLRRARLFSGVEGIYVIQDQIRVDKVAVSGAHVLLHGSCARPPRRPPAGGLISNAQTPASSRR